MMLARDAEAQQRIDALNLEYSTSDTALHIIREYYAYVQSVKV